MRQIAVQVVEVAGAAAVVYGLSLLAVWLAWIVGGLLLIAGAAAFDDEQS